MIPTPAPQHRGLPNDETARNLDATEPAAGLAEPDHADVDAWELCRILSNPRGWHQLRDAAEPGSSTTPVRPAAVTSPGN